MTPRQTWLFVASLTGMSVSAAVLILLVPSLFRADAQVATWVVGVLAGLVMAFGFAALYWRPSISPRDNQ